MNSFIVRYVVLSYALRGVTVRDVEGNYNIYINARMACNIQRQTLDHEIEHIRRKHFDSQTIVKNIEKELTHLPVKGF